MEDHLPETDSIEFADPPSNGDLLLCSPEDAQNVVFAVIKELSHRDRTSIDLSNLQEFLETFDVNTFVVNAAGMQLDVDGFRIGTKLERNSGKHKLAIFAGLTKDQEKEILEWLRQVSTWVEAPSHDETLLERCVRYWQMRVNGELPVEKNSVFPSS